MSAPYAGRCACGAVTIALKGEPVVVRQCWCRHCQHLAGGHATTNALFKTDDLTVCGELRWNRHVADSGNSLHWGFCPECGSQMLAWSSARPHLRVVRVGALDQPHGLRPQQIIWTSQAPDWAIIDPAAAQFAEQPPPPPPAD